MKNIYYAFFLMILSISVAKSEPSTSAPATNGIIANIQIGSGRQSAYASNTTASPGDEINFQVYAQNVGTSTASRARIIDTLDSRLKYVVGSSKEYTKQDGNDVEIPIKDAFINTNGQTLRWGFGEMANRPDKAIYLTFKARLMSASEFPIGQSNIKNHVIVILGNKGFVTPTVVATVNRPATPMVNLVLRSDIRNPQRNSFGWADNDQQVVAAPGDILYYRVIVQNVGNVPAKSVLLKDILPLGMTLTGDCKLYQDKQIGMSVSSADFMGRGLLISDLLNGSDHAATITFSATVGPEAGNQYGLTNTTQAIYENQIADEAHVSVLPTLP